MRSTERFCHARLQPLSLNQNILGTLRFPKNRNHQSCCVALVRAKNCKHAEPVPQVQQNTADVQYCARSELLRVKRARKD